MTKQCLPLRTTRRSASLERPSPNALALAIQGVLLGLSIHTPQLANAAEPAQNPVTLQEIQVNASAESASDLPKTYAGGQVAKGARLGALGNQSVMDTPFNTTAYTAEHLQNQQAHTLADVLVSDPSVRFTTSSGHQYENFRIRGFDVNQNDLAINGMFGLAPLGHTPLEMFERVEVLKGPSAVFSGMAPSGAVGGVVNLVPKRAGDEPLTRISVSQQSKGQFGSSVDVGRRFGADKAFGLRLNAATSDGKTDLDGQTKQRELFSAAFDYRSNELKASLDAYHSKETFTGGSPAMFWFNTTNIPEAPNPGTNQFKGLYSTLESNGLIARGEYAIDRNLSAFASVGARNHDYSGYINGTHIRNLNAAGTSTTTTTSAQRGYTNNISSEAGLRANFSTAEVAHEVVVHASNLDQVSGSATNTSSAFTTNIYAPTDNPLMNPIPGAAPKTDDATLTSLAFVDTLSFLNEKVRLTLGLRDQQVKTNSYSTSTGAVTASYEKHAMTPTVAVVVKPWGPSLSLYANYVQGLSKGDVLTGATYTGATNYGAVLEPYKTEQKEAGVKWDAGSFTNTVSLFEVNKPMLVKVTSGSTFSFTNDGEKSVRGLEWNTFGELTRSLRLLGGIAYTLGVQAKTALGTNDGRDPVGVPRWQANLGTEWDTPWITGLTLSGMVQASSSQFVDAANTMEIPGWSQVDLGARYNTQITGRKVVLRLNVNNVFDRHYYAGAFSDSTPIATLGPARSVMASATVDF